MTKEEYQKQYHEQYKEKRKQYYTKHPEVHEAHKEAERLRIQNYRKSNPTHTKEVTKLQMQKWRNTNPIKKTIQHRKDRAGSRGLGYIPLNTYFEGSASHHLFLERSKDFVVFIPNFLHKIFLHNHKTGKGMETINSAALDFWVNELIYHELFLISQLNEEDTLQG